MSITTKDIAKICNVSRGTVDRALNDRPGISEKTRERIRAVAREHNYTPHLIGAALSKGKTMTIGVLVFDLHNRYFSQVADSISRAARKRGYSTLIAVSEKDIPTESQVIQSFSARSVDGMIIVPITCGETFSRRLRALDMPIITIGNPLAGFHHVSIDDALAAYQSAEYIYEKGYRKICFICPPLRKKGGFDGQFNIASQELRAKGFLDFCREHESVQHEILLSKAYPEEAAAMVRAGGEKTAFFCSSDVYAIDLMNYFKKQKIRLPADAGLMGFDNLDILQFIEPRITTVSTSAEAQGELALDTMTRLIDGVGQPVVQYLTHRICEGETL